MELCKTYDILWTVDISYYIYHLIQITKHSLIQSVSEYLSRTCTLQGVSQTLGMHWVRNKNHCPIGVCILAHRDKNDNYNKESNYTAC